MQDTPTTPALTRTWQAHVTDEMDGAVVSARTHTVTLTRARVGAPLRASVDGQPADLRHALGILQGAWKVEVLAEVRAPAPIGKPAACALHRELGRLGFRDHYATASEALGVAVVSLAALSAADAHTVRSYAYGQWGMTG